MRIGKTSGPVATTASPVSTRAASATFSLTATETTRTVAASTALRTIGGIDALIALQGIEEPAERRRRALKQGNLALDALDELKIGLLGGQLSPATLTRLKAVAVHLKGGSGDLGLDGVLAEIELRVEVELAKMAPR